jgi:predicted RNase H-like nuclease
MNIAPTPEFQQAFKLVTGLECSPRNVITVVRMHPDLFNHVREVHADICLQNSLPRRAP